MRRSRHPSYFSRRSKRQRKHILSSLFGWKVKLALFCAPLVVILVLVVVLLFKPASAEDKATIVDYTNISFDPTYGESQAMFSQHIQDEAKLLENAANLGNSLNGEYKFKEGTSDKMKENALTTLEIIAEIMNPEVMQTPYADPVMVVGVAIVESGAPVGEVLINLKGKVVDTPEEIRTWGLDKIIDQGLLQAALPTRRYHGTFQMTVGHGGTGATGTLVAGKEKAIATERGVSSVPHGFADYGDRYNLRDGVDKVCGPIKSIVEQSNSFDCPFKVDSESKMAVSLAIAQLMPNAISNYKRNPNSTNNTITTSTETYQNILEYYNYVGGEAAPKIQEEAMRRLSAARANGSAVPYQLGSRDTFAKEIFDEAKSKFGLVGTRSANTYYPIQKLYNYYVTKATLSGQ